MPIEIRDNVYEGIEEEGIDCFITVDALLVGCKKCIEKNFSIEFYAIVQLSNRM